MYVLRNVECKISLTVPYTNSDSYAHSFFSTSSTSFFSFSKDEQMQIKVVERTQEILVQEQEIMRRERELDSTVRRPAEAEKFKLEKLAEATRNRMIMEAEADAEAEILRGEAEAFAIEAKAKAEAEKMAKKADAWKEYKEAAILAMMLDSMPKVLSSELI